MKRRISAFCLLIFSMPLLAACRKEYDYTKHISELKSDIFRAETEEFSLTLSCVSREYPYLADGIACPMNSLVEISLKPVAAELFDYEVYFGEGRGGEASFRSAYGDWFYSESVSSFPEKEVSLRVVRGDESFECTATSVKTEEMLSPEKALSAAIGEERERIGRMTADGVFQGEFYVRLLRRDRTYYYVGIVEKGCTLSLLLDAETGEVLAKRENRS